MTGKTDHGGGGFNCVPQGLLAQGLERGDSAVRSFVSVQTSLAMYPIYALGSEEQKRKWLPAMARGEVIGCFGLTEPDVGSNPQAIKTRATKTERGWRLSGTKMWITNGSIADIAIVWAKDDDDIIRGFIIEKGWDGFSTTDMHGKFSLRASVTSELIFDEVHVPEQSQLPKAEGLAGPLQCLNQARYGIAWGAIGAAMACY